MVFICFFDSFAQSEEISDVFSVVEITSKILIAEDYEENAGLLSWALTVLAC
jgi:hypothetical protein